MLHFLALIGVVSISFSAVFVRLASVSPATATFYRAVYAVPALAALWAFGRAEDRRSSRERWLGIASGLLLALDLTLWHESIALVGAGLGTVIANVQVVFVALAAWVMWGQKPTARTWMVIAIVLTGVALTSGLARHDAYGTSPVLGAIVGVLAGACYAAFLLVFRVANTSLAPAAGPLLDSTIGAVAGALVCGIFDARFGFRVSAEAHFWLFLLAIVSQVIGWLLIAKALARLPAIETSILLLGQPVLTVVWGVVFFAERLSPIQWAGTAVVIGGVGAYSVMTKG